MTLKFEELRRELLAVLNDPRRKFIIDFARHLEYASLDYEVLPEEIFFIYTEALSNRLLCSKSGSEELLSGIYNDFFKTSEHAREQLLDLFLCRGPLFLLPELRLTVSDLIARKYTPKIAIETFSKMWISKNPCLQDIAYMGAQTISRLVPELGQDREALRKLGEIMKTKK